MNARRFPPLGVEGALLGAVLLVFAVLLVTLGACRPRPTVDVEAVRPARDTITTNDTVQWCAFSHRPDGAPAIIVPHDSAKAAATVANCTPAFTRWVNEQAPKS